VAEGTLIDRVRGGTLALFLPGETRSDRLAMLDTVRAFAVLAVVLHHTWYVAGSPPLDADVFGHVVGFGGFLEGCGLGVDIFFVLSGFLLSMPWHRAAVEGKPKPNLARYATRRFLRIVPPYWFMLLVMLLLMANTTIPWDAVGTPEGVRAIVTHVFFAQYLFPSTSGGFAAVNGSVWTLTIEMLFYITLPVLIYAFVKRRWRIGLPVSILFSLFWVYLSYHHLGALVNHLQSGVAKFGVQESTIRYFLSTQYLAFIGEFGIGITVAGWWVRRRSRPPSDERSQWLAGAGAILAMLAALFFMYADGNHGGNELLEIVARMSVAAGVGLMILGFLAGPALLRRPLSFLPFRLYGVIGYSVFLWHLPLLTVMSRWPIYEGLSPDGKFWKILAIGLPVTTIFGVVMYLLIERPFLIYRPGQSRAKAALKPEPALAGDRPLADPEAW
jgi:peptidoglycan/LPS O-acetylase OafA/YrhL